MADYFNLYAGKSKQKMTLIMTDLEHKVENYKYALEKTQGCNYKFFKIEPAGNQKEPYRKKNKGGYWRSYNKSSLIPNKA